jgi:hypothetical protein
MQLAQSFAGADLLESTLHTANPRLTAYVGRRGRALQLAVFNKSMEPAAVRLPVLFTSRMRHAEQMLLTGPAFDSTEASLSAPSPPPGHLRRVEIPAHSAILYKVES